jgi:reverse transcriptase-like protein
VCRLEKSLYGLKRSPRQRYTNFDAFMLANNFANSSYNLLCLMRTTRSGSLIHLTLYMDDVLIACKSALAVEKLKEQLSKEFDMKDLGEG